MQEIPRILDELQRASLRVMSVDSPKDLEPAILNAIADLCGTDQVGYLVQRATDGAYRVFTGKSAKQPIDDVIALFHLDEKKENPIILQLPERDAASYDTFRENGWFSTVLVPVNRKNFSILAWAVRGEDMPGFSDLDLSALGLLVQYAALVFESDRGRLIFEHLFGAPGDNPEEATMLMDAASFRAGRLREGKPAPSYITSLSSIGDRDTNSPGTEIAFNDKKRTITNGTATVHLTMTEARLFQALWNHRNEMLLHVELVQMTHGYQVNAEEASKILRPVVSRLRNKLRAFIHGERWIKNVRGTGYVMGEF